MYILSGNAKHLLAEIQIKTSKPLFALCWFKVHAAVLLQHNFPFLEPKWFIVTCKELVAVLHCTKLLVLAIQ